jgi:hypothetical protein
MEPKVAGGIPCAQEAGEDSTSARLTGEPHGAKNARSSHGACSHQRGGVTGATIPPRGNVVNTMPPCRGFEIALCALFFYPLAERDCPLLEVSLHMLLGASSVHPLIPHFPTPSPLP